MLNQAPPEFETPIEFVTIDPERLREVHHEHDYVSREVPPPADEAGGAETREGAVWHPGIEAVAAPSMEVDIVETQEDDLRESST